MRSDIKKFWPSNFKVTRIIKSIHLEYLPECTDIFVINKTQNYQQPAFSVHSDTHLCRIEASIFWKCSQKWIKFYKHKMIITTWRALEKNLINITKNPHTGKHFSPQFFANQPTGSNIFRKFISRSTSSVSRFSVQLIGSVFTFMSSRKCGAFSRNPPTGSIEYKNDSLLFLCSIIYPTKFYKN